MMISSIEIKSYVASIKNEVTNYVIMIWMHKAQH